MNDSAEQDDEKARSGEAKAEQEPSALPFYDPLVEPWEAPPAPAALGAAEAWEDPVFGWGTGSEAVQALRPFDPSASLRTGLAQGRLRSGQSEVSALAWEPAPAGTALPRQEGAWRPAGYQGPYPEAEGLSELQRRLREGTITVPRPERRWAVTIREVVETLLLALLIFLAVRTSFQNFRVEGLSMVPSLEDGEYLIVNKLSYAKIDLSMFDWLPFYGAGDNPVHHLWAAPARGDVIVFRAPTSVDRDFIKRIIGVPGDTVQIVPDTNQVQVNGQVIQEPYIQGTTTCNRGCGPWTVPPANTKESLAACGSTACYFVMGDNRANSSDSRHGWLVPEENIIGKALITYWHKGGPELELAPNRSVSLASEAAAEE